MVDFTVFYKDVLPKDDPWPSDCSWDLFVSAYNSSDRVQAVFAKASAGEKHWLIHPDYKYSLHELPSSGKCFAPQTRDEAEFVRTYFEEAGIYRSNGISICVDITGFVKPYMMFVLRWLVQIGVPRVDILYSEPNLYEKGEETKFSDEAVSQVRQIAGFEGLHSPDTSNDLLIIGAGYDHKLIAHAAESRDNARKIQIFGLPSLRADFYQENILRAHRAAEAIGTGCEEYFAPANDPFVTAMILDEIHDKEAEIMPITNLYLCPVATKPQALGFAIYYLWKRRNTATSMIYPFCESHSRRTSEGLARIWRYVVELPSTQP